MHSAERKFACDICEKNQKRCGSQKSQSRCMCMLLTGNTVAKTRATLLLHMAVHQSADKRHSCDNCQKTFSFNTSLSKHMHEVNISVQKDSSVISVTLKANEKLRYDITKLFTNQICGFPASFAPQLSPSKVLLSNTWKISIKRTEQILFLYLCGLFSFPRCALYKYTTKIFHYFIARQSECHIRR